MTDDLDNGAYVESSRLCTYIHADVDPRRPERNDADACGSRRKESFQGRIVAMMHREEMDQSYLSYRDLLPLLADLRRAGWVREGLHAGKS